MSMENASSSNIKHFLFSEWNYFLLHSFEQEDKIVIKHTVASIYVLLISYNIYIYLSLMQLVTVTIILRSRHVSTVQGHHQVTATMLKTAALYGMSISYQNWKRSVLINFSCNQLKPILLVGIVYSSKRFIWAIFPAAWMYWCYHVVLRCRRGVVFSYVCPFGCRFITRPV
jgi:hypothetical protein